MHYSKLRPLFGKVLSSIADQATSSGTNFLMNVLLARWLSRTEYGAFSVCWSFCLIFAAFHNAIILEPMTVVGPAEHGSRISKYLKVVARVNWYAVATLGVLAGITGLFYREPEVRHALALLAVCLPGYLLLLTARREQYVLGRPFRAFQISLGYAFVVAVLLAIFRFTNRLSDITGILCIGMALPVAVWASIRGGSYFRDRDTSERIETKTVVGEHWHYGRWLFASAILAVGIPDIQTILLSTLVDLKSAGALRAIMNFVLPLSQLLTVLSVYALPGLSRQMKRFGRGLGLRQAILFPISMTILAAVYLGVLVAFGPLLEKILYNGRMSQYLVFLPALAFAAFLSAVGAGISTLLRAAQNSQHQLIAGIAATAVGVGAGLILLPRYGLHGAITSIILANAASSACIAATYIFILRTQPASWSVAVKDLFGGHKDEGTLMPATATEWK